MDTKRFCRTCEKIKSITEFAKSKTIVTCKACQKMAYEHREFMNKENKMELMRQGYSWHEACQILDFKIRLRDLPERDCQKCRRSLPRLMFGRIACVCFACENIKETSRRKTKVAIREGLLVSPGACEACQEKPWKIIHHIDYAHPLRVMWLCSRCHLRLHENLERERLGKKPIPSGYW